MSAEWMHQTAELLEAAMLVCFGSSWPFQVFKTWRSKTAAGKSLLFLSLLLTGYVCGFFGKLLREVDWVALLYVCNAALVSTDLILSLRYRKRDKLRAVQHGE